MNGIKIFDYTNRTYATEFKDVGTTFEGVQKIKRDETLKAILIFRVDKELKEKRFALYYQELDKNPPYSRKIKINTKNVSTINKNKSLKKGDDLVFTLKDNKIKITVEETMMNESVDVRYQTCTAANKCTSYVEEIYPPQGNHILQVEFSSEDFEGKELIDFLRDYGKINCIDSKNKTKSIKVQSAFKNSYNGKLLYIVIPDDQIDSKISLDFTVRNQNYSYLVYGGE
jgi:hypothetical protein